MRGRVTGSHTLADISPTSVVGLGGRQLATGTALPAAPRPPGTPGRLTVTPVAVECIGTSSPATAAHVVRGARTSGRKVCEFAALNAAWSRFPRSVRGNPAICMIVVGTMYLGSRSPRPRRSRPTVRT